MQSRRVQVDLKDLLASPALRAVADSVRDYALFLLDPSGKVLTWNTGAQQIKGYAASEIVGESFERFYTEQDRASGRPRTLLAEAARTGRVEQEGWRVRKDGSQFWADVVISRTDRAPPDGGGPAPERGDQPADDRQREGLRHLHVGPGRAHHQLERRGGARQGLPGQRGDGATFLPFLLTRGRGLGKARKASPRRGGGRARRGRRLARAQGRHPLLGGRGDQPHHRRRRKPDRIHQGHARSDGSQASGGGRERARAPAGGRVAAGVVRAAHAGARDGDGARGAHGDGDPPDRRRAHRSGG